MNYGEDLVITIVETKHGSTIIIYMYVRPNVGISKANNTFCTTFTFFLFGHYNVIVSKEQVSAIKRTSCLFLNSQPLINDLICVCYKEAKQKKYLSVHSLKLYNVLHLKLAQFGSTFATIICFCLSFTGLPYCIL